MQRLHGWIGRKDRKDVSIDAVVTRDDGSSTPVKLTNVSREGCRIDGENNLRIGEWLTLSIPEVGPVKAQVRWALADSAGMRFDVDEGEA